MKLHALSLLLTATLDFCPPGGTADDRSWQPLQAVRPPADCAHEVHCACSHAARCLPPHETNRMCCDNCNAYIDITEPYSPSSKQMISSGIHTEY